MSGRRVHEIIDEAVVERAVRAQEAHRGETGAHSSRDVPVSTEVLAASMGAAVQRFGMTRGGFVAVLEIAYGCARLPTTGAVSPDDWMGGFTEGALFGLMLAEVRDAG